MELEPKRGPEREQTGAERAELPEKQVERAEVTERKAEQNEAVEQAREAIQSLPEQEQAAAPSTTPEEKAETVLSYRQVLKTVQHSLAPAARRFSRFIHNPVVEPASDLLEKTVMRPSVVIGATITAVVVDGVLYLYAKHYGLALPGSVLLFTLLLGAFIGLAIEIWRGRKSRRK